MTELKLGSQGAEVFRFYDFMHRYAASYAFLLGKRDGYYGSDEKRFTVELQRRLNVSGVSGIVIDGVFGDRTASAVGYRWTGTSAPPVVAVRRKIWIYTCPGSGANWDQGPSFDLGNRCKDVLNLNHQPVYFQKGGYLGFLGGDAKFSYDEVIWDQYKSIESLLDHNADAQEALVQARAVAARLFPDKGEGDLTDADLIRVAQDVEYEHDHSGYSQSAQGVEEACEMLYGDGGFVHPGDPTQTPSEPGKYRLIRHTLKRVVQFGNPSTKGTGIARKVRSTWLDKKIRNVNYDNDFYAVVPQSDKIRPAMYAIIVKAEMELPFFVHVLRLAARIVPEWLTFLPIGGLFGPLAQLTVAGMAGLNAGAPLLSGFFGQAGSSTDTQVDEDIYNLLKPTGVLANIPGIIGLVAALPGLDAHGRYPFDPVMMDKAFSYVASFRR